MCVISSVGSSFTVAMFFIDVLSSMSFTVTLNSSVVLSPAFKFTSIPLANSSAELPVAEPFTFILPGTNVVPVGIVSFTTIVAGAFSYTII